MIIFERQEKWKGYKGIDNTAQNFSLMKQQLQTEESWSLGDSDSWVYLSCAASKKGREKNITKPLAWVLNQPCLESLTLTKLGQLKYRCQFSIHWVTEEEKEKEREIGQFKILDKVTFINPTT